MSFILPCRRRYVLETAAGFAQEHAIATGTPHIAKLAKRFKVTLSTVFFISRGVNLLS
jgi:hypothetical protein